MSLQGASAAQSKKAPPPTPIALEKLFKELMTSTGPLLAQPDHPRYQTLFQQFKKALKKPLFAEHFLAFCCNTFKKEASAIQIAQLFEKESPQKHVAHVEKLTKRINAMVFLLETVLSRHSNLEEIKLTLLNILWEDILRVFEDVVTLLAENGLNLGENHPYFERILKYHAVVEKYAPVYKTFLDSIVEGKTVNVSRATLEGAQTSVFNGYANFIKIHTGYAYICNLFGARHVGRDAYLEAKQLFEVLKRQLSKVISLAHLEPTSASKALEESLKPKVEFLLNFYEGHAALPYSEYSGTLYLFTQEYTQELMSLDSSSLGLDQKKLDETVHALKMCIKEAVDLNDPADLTPTMLATNKLFSLKFKNALINLGNLSDVNLAQAKILLPLHRELLARWRKIFVFDPSISAKLLLEKLDILIRTIVTHSLVLSQTPILSSGQSTSTKPSTTLSAVPFAASTTLSASCSTLPGVEAIDFLRKIENIAKELPTSFKPGEQSNQEGAQRLIVKFKSLNSVVQGLCSTQKRDPTDHFDSTVALCHEIKPFFGDPMLAGLVNAAAELMLSWQNYFTTNKAAEDAVQKSTEVSQLFLASTNKMIPPPNEQRLGDTPLVDEKKPAIATPVVSNSSLTPSSRKLSPSKQRRREQRKLEQQEKEALLSTSDTEVESEKKSPDHAEAPLNNVAEIMSVQESQKQISAIKQSASISRTVKPLLAYQQRSRKHQRREERALVLLEEKKAEPNDDFSSKKDALAKKQQRDANKARKKKAQEEARHALEQLQLAREQTAKNRSKPKVLEKSNEHENLVSAMSALSLESSAEALTSTAREKHDNSTASVVEPDQALQDLNLASNKSIISASAPEYIPKYITAPPTSRTIIIDNNIKEILTILNKAGYYAVVVGGNVRDKLLGRKPNDYDILTNCPKDKIASLINNVSVTEHSIKIGDEIDFYCSDLPLENELALRDLYINTLVADRDGIVYDYCGALNYIDKPFLSIVGSDAEKFQQNPTLFLEILNEKLKKHPEWILHLVRYANQLKKFIPAEYVVSMQTNAPFITSLKFGIYKKNIEKLFLRGQATQNVNLLNSLSLAGSILPPLPCLFRDMLPYYHFLYKKLNYIDCLDPSQRKETLTPYHILGLLLLPQIIEKMREKGDLNICIENTIAYFCTHYSGPFEEADKSCFQKQLTCLLATFHVEYLQYLPNYLHLVKQEQARQLALLQQAVPEISPNPVAMTAQYERQRSRGMQSSMPNKQKQPRQNYAVKKY